MDSSTSNRILYRVHVFLWFGVLFGLGHVILSAADSIHSGLGTIVADCLVLAFFVWTLFWERRQRQANKTRRIACGKCRKKAFIHVTDVVGRSEGSRPPAKLSHYCRRHHPIIKIPERLLPST